MEFKSIDPWRGSDITFTAQRWARNSCPYVSIVHLSFEGNYRDGSSGAPDAHYMVGIRSIVQGAWYPSAMILDLSKLSYDWGDEMDLLIPSDGDRDAVIVGDQCSNALATLMFGIDTRKSITDAANYFDNFASALAYVANYQLERWNKSELRLDLSQAKLLSLEDLLNDR
ncbi:MAG: hypothetical protein U0930_17550 [Pirellulales bacterium]